jgi:hypothetical protein
MYKLKLFSDKSYLTANPDPCPMLVPFWGGSESRIFYKGYGVFASYMEHGKDFFDMVDTIEEADLVVLPSTYYRYLSKGTQAQAYELADRAAAAQKPIVVFNERDWDFKFPRDNAILFSPTLEPANPRPNQFAVPGWAPAYVNDASEIPLREKQDKPVVGFCGWVKQPDLKERIGQLGRMYVPHLNQKHLGDNTAPLYFERRHRFLRQRTLEYLQQSSEVETNFIIRDKFFGGVHAYKKEGGQELDANMRDQFTQQYIDNLFSSDYILCARGLGNFSFRFYETMGSGRLPLFINTDCVLPYEFEIDWSSEMCWVEADDVTTVGQALAAYHARLSPEQFVEKQVQMRKLWEEWFSPVGFFKNFYRHMDHVQL